jgi:hypothetical protein
MAYTIKGLAKANECENQDKYGLAEIWAYWIACNSNDKQSVNDFLRLRKAERKEMMDFLREEYPNVANHILSRIDF